MSRTRYSVKEQNSRVHIAEESKYSLPLNSSSGYTLDRKSIAAKASDARSVYLEVSKRLAKDCKNK